MNFIINKNDILQTHSPIHNIHTRSKHHLHRPNAKISCFQNSTFYDGIQSFNNLPPSVQTLNNDRAKFQGVLRKYQQTHPFYSVNWLCVCKDDL